MLRRKRKANNKGQSMVELALVLPILLLVVCGIVDFGWIFSNNLITGYASREGARMGTIVAAKADAQTQITNRALAVSPSYARAGLTVATTFSNPVAPANGDVKVTVSYTFPLLTPLAQMLLGEKTYTTTSACQMKAE